ncbi:hypothetical protein SAMD00019534_040300 [Acytostelium subglobosum LB1]|uniref:hypothetical protein n=1 Tax=Acytostelium subglobosum LB1 TaxID=1410327 RepID=UPI000644CBFD|nr:hypothetical protein SAMD00019534_040300 [Acytostelium subglobosum LB1]GAM20855.1 hypothetical protein SAMD00019534_040300 [Acytostelium subglobosum LB1]|eukprot:XP_012755989.1 hypothetical protein SAMD00019534_040300 [Acytostelium subglobosum LB1]
MIQGERGTLKELTDKFLGILGVNNNNGAPNDHPDDAVRAGPIEQAKIQKNEMEVSGYSTMCILGSFNKGKSYILSRIFGLNFESSSFSHTVGISVVMSRGDNDMTQNIIGLDTKGSQQAVVGGTKEGLTEAGSTEHFLKCLSFYLSDVILIVVDRLTTEDQVYIHQMKYMLKKEKNTTKRIIVVHNLPKVTTLEQMDQVIKEDIVDCCKAKLSDPNRPYWAEEDHTKHVVLAHDERLNKSPAGLLYNQRTILMLKEWLKAAASETLKPFRLLETVVEFTNQQLGRYFRYTQLPKVTYKDDTVIKCETNMNVIPEYADLQFNLIGIMNENSSQVKARVAYDKNHYYISLFCPGYEAKDLQAQANPIPNDHGVKVVITSKSKLTDLLPPGAETLHSDLGEADLGALKYECVLPCQLTSMNPSKRQYQNGNLFLVYDILQDEGPTSLFD